MLETDYNLIPTYNTLTCLKPLMIPQSNFVKVQLILNIFHTYVLPHDFK